MIRNALTVDELRALPPLIDLPTTARALGIGRSQAYSFALADELPVRVLRIGSRTLRVRSADILALLGVTPSPTSTGGPHDVTGDAPRTHIEVPSPTPGTSMLRTALANENGAVPHVHEHHAHIPATPSCACGVAHAS